MFARLLDDDAAHVTDLVLLAEEVATVGGELPGNHPRALSHIGLVAPSTGRS